MSDKAPNLKVWFDFDFDTYRARTEEALRITDGIEIGGGTNFSERDCEIRLRVGADRKAIERELLRCGFRLRPGACDAGAAP